MAKKITNDYWVKRFEALENASNEFAQHTYADIEKAFNQAQRKIQAEIDVWYNRIAVNNNISLKDAKKLLNAKELKEFKWDVKEYIKYGKDNSLNGEWMKELENASAKYHISRLESLKIRTQHELEKAFGNELDSIDEMARRVYTDDYYHSAYEIQKGFNIGFNIGQIDDKKLDKLINKPWAADGKNFSNRIWQSKTSMINDLHNELVKTCILGKSPDKAIENMTKYVDKKFKNAKLQAGRLIMTEQAFFSSAAQRDCFNELEVERYEIVATLDSHTSDTCRELDGQTFPMKDFQPGVTAPPFHVWCRSTTVPFFEDNFGGERAARGEDGKTYYVSDKMKYEDWKNSFVDGKVDDNLQELPKSDIIKEKINGVECGSPMTFEEADSGHVNPKYGTDYGYSINCQSCVPTFEARLRGYDVQVKANTKGSMCEKLSYKTNLAWIDPTTGEHPEYILDKSKTTAKQYLEFIKGVVKPKERYSIEFSWSGRTRAAHIVNLDLNEDGLLRIKDNQRGMNEISEYIGDAQVLKYLSKMKYVTTIYGNKIPCVPKLLRIDNMEFNYEVVNEIMEGVMK